MSRKILLDELFVLGGRVQQVGARDREEGLFGAGEGAGDVEAEACRPTCGQRIT